MRKQMTPHSASCISPYVYAASASGSSPLARFMATPPPGTFVLMGVLAYPLFIRGLNQNAHSHTFAPGVMPGSKATSTTVRVVLPWNVHADVSAGGVAPTNEKIAAPATPGGFPRVLT